MVSSSPPPINFDVAIHKIVREEWGYLLSSLVKNLSDINLAEDALQDAVEAALIHWRSGDIPKSPRAWLLTTAKRKAIDRFRRDKNFQNKMSDISLIVEEDIEKKEQEYTVPDERLRLIFTCCHPSLDHKTSVALTLRLLGGLSTVEIARSFLVKNEAMAQRLVRGKKKIQQAAIPFIIPEREVFAERLDAVLKVVYLIFNEGYASSSGDKHIRSELCDEAIRLARILNDLCGQEPEVNALLALMLLHDSRRTSRISASGDFVPLDEQDRNLWSSAKIEQGATLIKGALKKGKIGSYQIQAAISAVHAEASSYEQTNWQEIVLLYEELYKISPTPVVKLNQLVASSNFISVEDSLENLNKLEEHFKSYQPFYAAKADLCRRSGKIEKAKECYCKAIELSGSEQEKEFLKRRLATI